MTSKKPGQILGLNLSITVTIGGLCFLFSLILIWAYITFEQYRKTLEFAAATIAASAGVTSAFYVAQNIKESLNEREDSKFLSDRSKKIDRALSYISAWNSPEMAHIKRVSRKIRQITQTYPENQQSVKVKEAMENDLNLNHNVVCILNFLEEIATAVKEELVDEYLIYTYYNFIFQRFCFVFLTWIVDERNTRKSDSLYANLTQLNEDWKKQQPRKTTL